MKISSEDLLVVEPISSQPYPMTYTRMHLYHPLVSRTARLALGEILILLVCSIAEAKDGKFVQFVDPFIGSANGGNTFPGAVRPWGMVSVSPHNDLASPSGYSAGQPWFYGLGQVHLSGTGCSDLGSVIVTATAGKISPSPEGYKCTIQNQVASPGFWAGTLVEPSVRVEATVTDRSGLIRFMPITDRGFNILIDAGRSLSLVGGGSIQWTSGQELEGYNIGGGFCGEANRHFVYFVIRFSRPPGWSGTWTDTVVSQDQAVSAREASVGAWARFSGTHQGPLEIRIGISYVSNRNARENLDREAGNRPFDQVRSEAVSAWENVLSRVAVSGGRVDDLTKFYTALYHSLIHPNVISDVNGEYPLLGHSGIGRNISREHYSVFSLWDTYRTLHPLLTLLYPDRQSAMVSTMLDMYRESGWLPKWEIAGNETHMMVGDGAVCVIADTYMNGVQDFDTLLAYEAMRKPGTSSEIEAEPSRPGYRDYVTLGYIPVDQDTSTAWWVWGAVSTTLEYCVADWAFSRIAERVGNQSDSREFRRRSLFYRNLFDTATSFLRPRKADGSWLSPFDPNQTEGSGNWTGSGGPGYVEGNAWQYTWFVPHDITGLEKLFGGVEDCAGKLSECFSAGHFTMNNEPDFSYPYLFSCFIGFERKTRSLVRDIMQNQFKTGPAGLPGNDDAGALSSWFVFSALGFFPVCPSSGEYFVGIPLFDDIRITLDSRHYQGRSIRIRTTPNGRSDSSPWVARWNEKPITTFRIEHQRMVKGGELTFPGE